MGILLALLGPVACATPGTPLPSAPPPEAIPDLERRVELEPRNPELLVRLGAAERARGRADEAVRHLEAATELDATRPSAHFFLALTYEDLDRPGDAIDAYREYLARIDEPEHEQSVEARIRVLQREQLQQAVQDALAREDQLARRPPSSRNVAVFPFLFAGADESLRPLGRALAAMLVTDLSETDRLQVLERLNVQVLVDEMDLGESGLVDPATAARSGYLLGAGNIVQGRIEGDVDRLALDAAVVEVADPDPGAPPSLSFADAADELFAMATRLALDIYEELGITLTPVERERVTRRRTQNLQAVLAYGRGLEAADRGAWGQAATFFRQAAALGSDFEEARLRAREAERAVEVDGSTDEFAAAAVEEVEAAMDRRAGGLTIPDFALPGDIRIRDPASEVTGAEGVRPPAILIIGAGGGDDR